ncbi:MAG: hypothetical protein ABSE89_00190 [Sedimentisphaerales bacterium]
MNHDELVSVVEQVINQFYINDSFLLGISVSEWSIAHRIAVYLEMALTDWDVDCEYNRTRQDGSIKQNAEGENKRPDIVVHHRGKVEIEHNLLVIEVKTANSSNDFEKLKDFTSKPEPDQERPFQYQYGLALSFVPDLSLHWFREGKELR